MFYTKWCGYKQEYKTNASKLLIKYTRVFTTEHGFFSVQQDGGMYFNIHITLGVSAFNWKCLKHCKSYLKSLTSGSHILSLNERMASKTSLRTKSISKLVNWKEPKIVQLLSCFHWKAY